MGLTRIEWTATIQPDGSVTPGYTFNPWRGCTKVSEGCKHCYAETLSGRNPGTLGVWGPKGSRPIAAESYWRQPEKWDRGAEAAGERRRVFCASLADVFEGPETMPAAAVEDVNLARLRLWALIEATPNLDWLLLTKRPQNALREGFMPDGWADRIPPNVWLGTSVEDQKTADERIPHLLKVPAAVRFLSCEPLLGPIDLTWISPEEEIDGVVDALRGSNWIRDDGSDVELPSYLYRDGSAMRRRYLEAYGCGAIGLVIVGGESGPNARSFDPQDAHSLLAQCRAAGVPFFMKQMGSKPFDKFNDRPVKILDLKGSDWEGYDELRVREFPEVCAHA